MADAGDDVAGLIEALGFERAHVCGLSLGGVVAQEFAARHPDKVDRLILADTFTGHGHLPPEERERRLQFRLEAAKDLAAFTETRAAALLSPGAPPELVEEIKAIQRELRPEGYRLAARALTDADTRPLLAKIKAPTLVLWGEADTVCSLDEARAIRAGIPGARLEIIPGAGHASNQEQPDAFNELVRRFLTA
jgi:3-oxoadipate enol-lactonase